MIKQIEKNDIFSLFNIDNFVHLEQSLDEYSPSLAQYHLENFFLNIDEESFLNKREIQNSFNIGDYSIYLDYDDNIYLESLKDSFIDTYQTSSLF
ncbi:MULTISPECIES: hypothetical protein [Arcobacteraceae]|uniref:Uncharacterized protein n=1 Tax=Arcobacter porcinus TaxID=1935204 RepID=A0A1C0AZT3_9BACT|nr:MULTISPECIES: hypothetical protein [Arcobacteraceae]OCL82818.1 hypothetical protein AAW29_01206 [Arcobacter porcinus]OCL85077.1 hypothetical protein AAW30_00221 [Arcobacter porcinus]OCL86627.1 hypothetical protein AAX30_01352 [Arcobacter porcinus]OCL93037.1 hypothetical protein AAX28_00577 [Arcobacter porcinus]OCL96789.1 hypothetical protein AAX27_00421 [Aliarcobacter thereius]